MLPLRKELFWDIDFNQLNVDAHKRLIIERIISLGNLDEFYFILNTYNTQTLVNVILQLGYLDPKTMSFVISHFNISKNKLKCYTRNRSTAVHWN
jgi:hypothetical protein